MKILWVLDTQQPLALLGKAPNWSDEQLSLPWPVIHGAAMREPATPVILATVMDT